MGEIAARTTPSVVVVEVAGEDGQLAGQGSGFVASDWALITNYHVIMGAKSIQIRLASGKSFKVQTVLGYSIEHDIAVLALPKKSAARLTIDGTQEPRVGDHVIAIGAPLGLEQTVAEGIISATRDYDGVRVIQTTVPISPGSSGGPLLDQWGKVIGVNVAGIQEGQNLNFAISARHIIDVLRHQHPISIEALLSETEVVQEFPAGTMSVEPADTMGIEFDVEQDGSVLEGTYVVKGGSNDDIAVVITTPNENGEPAILFDSGPVKVSGRLKLPLAAGHYALVFSNEFSTFSSKSVTPDVRLRYYRPPGPTARNSTTAGWR